jgi:hypothetical protein
MTTLDEMSPPKMSLCHMNCCMVEHRRTRHALRASHGLHDRWSSSWRKTRTQWSRACTEKPMRPSFEWRGPVWLLESSARGRLTVQLQFNELRVEGAPVHALPACRAAALHKLANLNPALSEVSKVQAQLHTLLWLRPHLMRRFCTVEEQACYFSLFPCKHCELHWGSACWRHHAWQYCKGAMLCCLQCLTWRPPAKYAVECAPLHVQVGSTPASSIDAQRHLVHTGWPHAPLPSPVGTAPESF